jgi:hypothetical protein
MSETMFTSEELEDLQTAVGNLLTETRVIAPVVARMAINRLESLRDKVDLLLLVKPEYLTYLDELRQSGETNMFWASPYLTSRFGLDKEDARRILDYWMKTFGERHPE